MSVPMNVALNKPATASSFVKPYNPTRAVNGTLDPTSRWLCNSLPGWLCVDLGAPMAINRWVVKHMTMANWKSPDYNMCDFMLQGSIDAKIWNNIDFVGNNTANSIDRTFTAATFRYVRLYVTKGIRTNPQLASCMELEIYQAPTNPNLQNISISSGTLTPGFASGIYTYTVTVDSDTSSITLTPTAIDPVNTTITINNTNVKSGTASQPIPLNSGINPITIKCLGAIGNTSSAYTVNVTRLKSAYLSNLTLSSGSLNPAFSKGQFSYTSSVGYDTASITLTPTAEDSGATIKVNDSVVASGMASQTIPLNVGTNKVTVVVTAADGVATQTYTVTMTRANSPYLQSLALSSGTLTPSFVKDTFAYSTAVADPTIIVTPTAEDSTASITVNGLNVVSGQSSLPITLNVGNNTISIKVTSNNGTVVKEYTVTVVRSSSANLTNLVIKAGKSTIVPTNPGFDKNIINYTATVVGTTIASVVVIPTIEDTNGVIKVNGIVVANKAASSAITLNAGSNTISVSVTPATGSVGKTYTVIITK